MADIATLSSRYHVSELDHAYGKNVHLLDDPLAWTLLARLCAQDTHQPEVGRLVKRLYEKMIEIVLAAEFPRVRIDIPTRMVTSAPEAVVRTASIARTSKCVTVGIARAGTMPSQVVYDCLNEMLEPEGVRQDHLFMSRKTDDAGKVIGADWHDAKIGRDVDGRTVFFPDPMGATGSSIVRALTHYKTQLDGTPAKNIVMHLILTPEYIKNVLTHHPDTIIYTWRLDRGLSPKAVLETKPGTRWAEEKGLNDHQYIVPGAGGVGELLNNSWI